MRANACVSSALPSPRPRCSRATASWSIQPRSSSSITARRRPPRRPASRARAAPGPKPGRPSVDRRPVVERLRLVLGPFRERPLDHLVGGTLVAPGHEVADRVAGGERRGRRLALEHDLEQPRVPPPRVAVALEQRDRAALGLGDLLRGDARRRRAGGVLRPAHQRGADAAAAVRGQHVHERDAGRRAACRCATSAPASRTPTVSRATSRLGRPKIATTSASDHVRAPVVVLLARRPSPPSPRRASAADSGPAASPPGSPLTCPRRSRSSTCRRATRPAPCRPCRRRRRASGGSSRARVGAGATRAQLGRHPLRGGLEPRARRRSHAAHQQRVGVGHGVARRRAGTRRPWSRSSTCSSSVRALRVADVDDHRPAGRQPIARQLEELLRRQVERDVRLAVGVEEDEVVALAGLAQERPRVVGVRRRSCGRSSSPNQRRPMSNSSPSISTASMTVSGKYCAYARATVPPATPSIATLRGGSSRSVNGSVRWPSQ